MNGFEFNKLLAAILVAMLVAMISGFVAHKLISPEKLTKNVYVVEGVATTPEGSSATAPAGPPPIGPLLAKADVGAGEKYARVCGTCHSFGKGEAAMIGPNLYGVVGGPHAHMEGYDYSDAMKAMHDKMWTFDELNEFLYNPRAHIPGTKMTFAGIKDDQTRANVIAWLRSLSDNPVPLPAK
jgi:cytochrome c